MNGENKNLLRCLKTRTCNLFLFGLIIFYISYVLLGAMVFMILEDEEDKKFSREMRKIYRDFLASQPSNFNETVLKKFLKNIAESLKNGDNIEKIWSKSDESTLSNWSFDQTLIFAVSVVTSIGYGNMTPKTVLGKIFTVLFAIFGIPMTFLIVSAIIQRIIFVTSKLNFYINNNCFSGHKPSLSWIIYCFTFTSIVLIIFFFFPSFIFYNLEKNWTYWDCFYFCFVSLTTIGFGDYVPAKDSTLNFRGLYAVCITSYLLMGIIFLMALIEEIYKTPCLRDAISLCALKENKDEKVTNEDRNSTPTPTEKMETPFEIKGYQSIDDIAQNPLSKKITS